MHAYPWYRVENTRRESKADAWWSIHETSYASYAWATYWTERQKHPDVPVRITETVLVGGNEVTTVMHKHV